jgi:hypothetical protein
MDVELDCRDCWRCRNTIAIALRKLNPLNLVAADVSRRCLASRFDLRSITKPKVSAD